MRILLVEDDPELGDGLAIGLPNRFRRRRLRDGHAADLALRDEGFDLVVLRPWPAAPERHGCSNGARDRDQSLPS